LKGSDFLNHNKGKSVIAYILAVTIIVVIAIVGIKMISEKPTKAGYGKIIKHFDDLEVEYYELDLGTGELKLRLKSGIIDKEKANSEDKDKTETDANDKTEAEVGDSENKDADKTETTSETNEKDKAKSDKEDKADKKARTKLYEVPNVGIFIEDTKDYRIRYNEANPTNPLDQNYIKIKNNSWLVTVVPSVIMLGLLGALFFYMMRQANGGGKFSGFGKANLKGHGEGRKATFADVAGCDEEKKELEEVVDFLKHGSKYREIGAKIPKGILLLGPPGTGKTLLARAVAGEAKCPFFSISGSDFVEMFVGVGASRVRDLFEQAKKHAPSIIFIDEIDAVGRHRGAGLGGGHDEREQTLNQLLVEMDGFTGNESVIVVAATNRRDILDPALLRPGRFDRQVVVGLPDVKGREEILRVHSKNKPLAPDVDLKVIAKTTQAFTGADLENLLNEGALLAARNNRKAVTQADIEEATLKVLAGPEKKSRIVTDRDRKITAYHEAGHAVVGYFLETGTKIHQVSIIQRGMAAGLTIFRPDNDDNHTSKREMNDHIVSLLAGRVAESLVLSDICTGASNDLERSTALARDMVMKYGFSEKIGHVVYGEQNGEVFLGKSYQNHTTKNYSETVAFEIDTEVRDIIEVAYKRSVEIATSNLPMIHRVANYLLENEKIDADDFDKLMKGEFAADTPDYEIKPEIK